MKPKTARVKSWDPQTQRYKYETVKVEGYYFTDDDRMKICSEFLESGEPISTFVEKYHLNSKEVIYGWLKKFLDGKNCVPFLYKSERRPLSYVGERPSPSSSGYDSVSPSVICWRIQI